MVAALLKFTQGVTVGTPGQALFGVDGTSVQVSNGASSPGPVTVWTFTVIAVPAGSSVPLGVAQSGATSTWSFTPDVDGCYLIEITVEDASGNTASDARCFGVKTTSGRVIPCFLADSASMNFGGQATGWDVYMESWLQALEALIGGGGGGYSTIKHDNIALPQRAVANFEGDGGTGVTGADVGGVSTIYISSPDTYDQNTTQAYGFAQTGQTLVPSNPTQIISAFLLDGTGGTPQFDLSASLIPNLQDGWIYIFRDPTGSWGTNPPQLVTTGGTVITVPGCPGVTSDFIQCPAFAGGAMAIMYGGVANAWSMLWCSSVGSWRTGTPLTGSSQTGSAPIVGVPESTTIYTVTVTMRVESVVGTPTEQVGDSWTTTAPLAWGNVSGTQTAVDDVVVGQAFIAAKTSMSVGASVTQTDTGVSFVTPSGLDAATTVSVTVTYTPQGNTSP